jgi:hypothetical protein
MVIATKAAKKGYLHCFMMDLYRLANRRQYALRFFSGRKAETAIRLHD